MKTDFDFERASALMDIMHKVSTIAPKATSILGLAQSELDEMNSEAKEIAKAAIEEAMKESAEQQAAEIRAMKAAKAARAEAAAKLDAEAQRSKTADIANNNARRV